MSAIKSVQSRRHIHATRTLDSDNSHRLIGQPSLIASAYINHRGRPANASHRRDAATVSGNPAIKRDRINRAVSAWLPSH